MGNTDYACRLQCSKWFLNARWIEPWSRRSTGSFTDVGIPSDQSFRPHWNQRVIDLWFCKGDIKQPPESVFLYHATRNRSLALLEVPRNIPEIAETMNVRKLGNGMRKSRDYWIEVVDSRRWEMENGLGVSRSAVYDRSTKLQRWRWRCRWGWWENVIGCPMATCDGNWVAQKLYWVTNILFPVRTER